MSEAGQKLLAIDPENTTYKVWDDVYKRLFHDALREFLHVFNYSDQHDAEDKAATEKALACMPTDNNPSSWVSWMDKYVDGCLDNLIQAIKLDPEMGELHKRYDPHFEYLREKISRSQYVWANQKMGEQYRPIVISMFAKHWADETIMFYGIDARDNYPMRFKHRTRLLETIASAKKPSDSKLEKFLVNTLCSSRQVYGFLEDNCSWYLDIDEPLLAQCFPEFQRRIKEALTMDPKKLFSHIEDTMVPCLDLTSVLKNLSPDKRTGDGI